MKINKQSWNRGFGYEIAQNDYIGLLKYIFMRSTGVLDIVDVYDCVTTSRVAVGDTEREDIDINQF